MKTELGMDGMNRLEGWTKNREIYPSSHQRLSSRQDRVLETELHSIGEKGQTSYTEILESFWLEKRSTVGASLGPIEQILGTAMVEEGRREVQGVHLDSAWAVCGVLVDFYVVRGCSGYLEHPRMQS